MRNIMVVDGCQDYFFDMHTVSDEDFARIFPNSNQNVDFDADLYKRKDLEELNDTFRRMWFNRRPNNKITGIHGTLFYENLERRPYYPKKIDIAPRSVESLSPFDFDSKSVFIMEKEPSKPLITCLVNVDLFREIFCFPGQDVIFLEDLQERFGDKQSQEILSKIKNSTIAKTKSPGIQGTFYIGYPERRMYFPNRIDADIPRHYPLAG